MTAQETTEEEIDKREESTPDNVPPSVRSDSLEYLKPEAVPNIQQQIQRVASPSNSTGLDKFRKQEPKPKCRSPREFLFLFCVIIILFDASSAFMLGATTSLEKHFHFSGKKISLIIILSQIGPTLTSLLVGYVGGKGDRPKWMALGTLMASLGGFINFLSFIIYPPSSLSESGMLESSRKFCNHSDVIAYQMSGGNTTEHTEICFPSNFVAFINGIVAFSLIAIGNCLLLTVGLPYMDDCIEKKDTPIYFSIVLAVRVFGPLIGLSLSAYAQQFYVYPHIDPGINIEDPRWIGAWWVGPLVFSLCLLIMTIFVFKFPRDLTSDHKKQVIISKSMTPSFSNGSSLPSPDILYETQNNNFPVVQLKEKANEENKDLRIALGRIIRNRVLVYTVLGDFFSTLAMMGLFFWLPKYLEHQFRVDKSTSNLYTGISSTSSIIVGMLGGGVFIRRCRPTARTLAILVLVCKLLYSLSLVGMMMVNCDFNDDQPGLLNEDGDHLDLHRSCSAGCKCGLQEFIPVCVEDGPIKRTYFSPCHAGCPTPSYNPIHEGSYSLIDIVPLAPMMQGPMPVESLNPTSVDISSYTFKATMSSGLFYNCTCGSSRAKVRSGYCKTTCSGFTIYIVINVIIQSFVSMSALGGLLITIRCVAIFDKGTALGVKATAVSLGMMIYPVIFGSLTDSSCLVWEEVCQDVGACWVYNAQDLGFKLHGTAAAILLISVLFDFLIAKNVRDVELLDNSPKPAKTITSNNSSATVSRTTSLSFGEENARSSVHLRSFRQIRSTPNDSEDNNQDSSTNKNRPKKKSSSYDSYIASFGRASIRNVKKIVDPSTREIYHLQQHHVFNETNTSIKAKNKRRLTVKQLSFDQNKDDNFNEPTLVRQSPVDDQCFDIEIFDITQPEADPTLSINGFKITGV